MTQSTFTNFEDRPEFAAREDICDLCERIVRQDHIRYTHRMKDVAGNDIQLAVCDACAASDERSVWDSVVYRRPDIDDITEAKDVFAEEAGDEA